ncbi:MAG: N-6 DNA methylase [Pyrinomonadaceae bacterium]
MDDLISLLKKSPPQSWRGEEKIKLQQFSTPPTIAFLMMAVLDPKKTELVLEPSAGTGSLAIWLRIAGCRVHLNELSETRRILLGLQGFFSTACNAEFLDDLLPEEIRPDAILMNPPFSANAGRTKSGDSNFGFRHINSALQRLKRGGRLVALFGTEALTKTQKGLKFLRDLSENFDLRAIIHLPKNAYYKYGTSLPVSILCIVKCEPQKPLNEVLKINCPNLEDVLSNAKIFD